MPKNIVTDQKLLELCHLLTQTMPLEDWRRWVEFQLCCDTPSETMWRRIVFGADVKLTSQSQGPLSRYFELVRPGRAGIYLHALSGTFYRIISDKNGNVPSGVMHGHYYRFFLIPSDIPHRRWCEIAFGSTSIPKNIGNANTPAAALFDVLISVWNSDYYQDSARLKARLLACAYLRELLITIEDRIPTTTPVAI